RSPSQIVRQSVLELKLQAEESFVLKVVQLEELLQVRHSVFGIGNASCCKSQVAAQPPQGHESSPALANHTPQ
ncbi:DYH17 protein, partial [Steatornis caripensis]|nr:DYH17 protein [Steatornis caripensis]